MFAAQQILAHLAQYVAGRHLDGDHALEDLVAGQPGHAVPDQVLAATAAPGYRWSRSADLVEVGWVSCRRTAARSAGDQRNPVAGPKAEPSAPAGAPPPPSAASSARAARSPDADAASTLEVQK